MGFPPSPTPAAQSVETGAVFDWPAAAAPTGYLLCDGAAVSRSTYADLFAVIGTVYGAGDGSTTFNLPDTQGRTTVGLGTHADVSALANDEGAALGSRRPAHKHTVVDPTITKPNVTVNDPGHTHPLTLATGNAGASALPSSNKQSTSSSSGQGPTDSAVTGITASLATTPVASGGTVGPQTSSPADAPAYLVVNKIIKT